MTMIESDIVPQQALDYLNSIQVAKNDEAARLGRIGARSELLAWCNQWFTSAQTWRKQSWEDDWLKWQRNADGRYDPVAAAKKKDWQSKVFVDLTPSHRENIHAELFRLIAGSRPIMDVIARPGGDPDQADNIKDLVIREMEKSRFEVEYNKILEDKDTYGSGFCRLWFKVQIEDRIVRVPITEPLDITSIGSIRRHMGGQPIILGYESQNQPKLIYRGACIEHVSIWDFFCDPKALRIKGATCLYRSKMTLQHILDSVARGEYMPESAMEMRTMASAETAPADKARLQAERGIAESAPRREGNQASWDGYELFGRLPQKWVYPLLTEPVEVTDADKLVPARVIFHGKTIFRVEINDDYEGEAPFLKDDYFPVNGRFYGRGIPEMLDNSQKVINEVVNQRLDEGNLALQQGIAVLEKALVNPEDLLAGGPGLVVRLDAKKLGPNGDIRNAIMQLPRPDVQINAGFNEVHEWERIAADRTSANRVIQGSPRLSDIGTRTLGGMQLLKNQAGEKFAFIAMLSEFTFLNEVFRAYWKLIYKNITPQDVVDALGQERASKFQLMSPEEVETAYRYEPKGIFEREAKATRQARLAALREQFGQAPWFDHLANFEMQAKSFEMDPSQLKVPEAEAMEIMAKAKQMAEPMAKQMLTDIVVGQAVKDIEHNMGLKVAEMSNAPAIMGIAAAGSQGDQPEQRPQPPTPPQPPQVRPG